MRYLILFFTLFASVSAFAGRNGGTRVTVNDNTNYTLAAFPNTGQFGGYLGAFGGSCAGTIGVDYGDTLSALPATFPNNSVISWRWPVTPAFSACGNIGVWAFLQIAFGNYSGGTYLQVAAQQVKNITTLKQHHAIRVGNAGSLDNFDVIDDFFLTSASGGGTNLFEIEICLHNNAAAKAFFNTATPIGTIVNGGVTWSVGVISQTPPDILFMKSDQTDVLSADLDFKAMFAYLIAQGQITGDEWYNGHGLGAEPDHGGGILYIDQYSVDYN